MSRPDKPNVELIIQYDDNATTIIDKVNALIEQFGISLVIDDLPHDGFEVYNLQSVKLP